MDAVRIPFRLCVQQSGLMVCQETTAGRHLSQWRHVCVCEYSLDSVCLFASYLSANCITHEEVSTNTHTPDVITLCKWICVQRRSAALSRNKVWVGESECSDNGLQLSESQCVRMLREHWCRCPLLCGCTTPAGCITTMLSTQSVAAKYLVKNNFSFI